MSSSYYFIKFLWQDVNTDWVRLDFGPQSDLSQNLVSERVEHEERLLSSRHPETTFSMKIVKVTNVVKNNMYFI
jgi:hypothetical protein